MYLTILYTKHYEILACAISLIGIVKSGKSSRTVKRRTNPTPAPSLRPRDGPHTRSRRPASTGHAYRPPHYPRPSHHYPAGAPGVHTQPYSSMTGHPAGYHGGYYLPPVPGYWAAPALHPGVNQPGFYPQQPGYGPAPETQPGMGQPTYPSHQLPRMVATFAAGQEQQLNHTGNL